MQTHTQTGGSQLASPGYGVDQTYKGKTILGYGVDQTYKGKTILGS